MFTFFPRNRPKQNQKSEGNCLGATASPFRDGGLPPPTYLGKKHMYLSSFLTWITFVYLGRSILKKLTGGFLFNETPWKLKKNPKGNNLKTGSPYRQAMTIFRWARGGPAMILCRRRRCLMFFFPKNSWCIVYLHNPQALGLGYAIWRYWTAGHWLVLGCHWLLTCHDAWNRKLSLWSMFCGDPTWYFL